MYKYLIFNYILPLFILNTLKPPFLYLILIFSGERKAIMFENEKKLLLLRFLTYTNFS